MTLISFGDWQDVVDDLFGVYKQRDLSTSPMVNIRKSEDSIVYEFAVPGMSKEDFSIETDGDHSLVVSAKKETRASLEDDKNKFIKREFNYNSFRKKIILPIDISSSDIRARYDNGILFVTLPVKKDRKKIDIKID